VESRDENNPYCSRVCCSEARKNALRIKRRVPGAAVSILNRDIRTYGLRDDFFRQARQEGVRFVRYSSRKEPWLPKGRQVKIEVPDLPPADQFFDADLLVLSTGIVRLITRNLGILKAL
jgi:heterodisulfide reductase subunit A